MPQRMYEPAVVAADDPINLFTYAHEPLAIEGKSHLKEADALQAGAAAGYGGGAGGEDQEPAA